MTTATAPMSTTPDEPHDRLMSASMRGAIIQATLRLCGLVTNPDGTVVKSTPTDDSREPPVTTPCGSTTSPSSVTMVFVVRVSRHSSSARCRLSTTSTSPSRYVATLSK